MGSRDREGGKILVPTLPSRPSHRLLFDRRYGWVFDEWIDPADEALAGGRKMFCILPLAKSFITTASDSINRATNFAVEVFKRPDLLSPQVLQSGLDKQLSKLKSSFDKQEFNYFPLKANSVLQSPSIPSHPQFETRESHTT